MSEWLADGWAEEEVREIGRVIAGLSIAGKRLEDRLKEARGLLQTAPLYEYSHTKHAWRKRRDEWLEGER